MYVTDKHCKTCKYECKLMPRQRAFNCQLIQDKVNIPQKKESGLKGQ